MKSQALGKNILSVEVTHVSIHGIWLLTDDGEFFLSYEDFPWFAGASIEKIINVQEPVQGYFFWPDIDVDLTIDSIMHPEKFPLKAKRTKLSNLEKN